jgi:transcriptional regulator GlxA family with amidase domain
VKIAYIIFDGITILDLIGIYDPISRLKSMNFIPGLEWDLCAGREFVSDNFHLQLKADRIRPDLADYDLLIVPGGFGTRQLQEDKDFITWLQAAKPAKYKVSICTGSLLLGAAGFLKGKKATTHFDNYQQLAPYCAEVVKERIVEDGDVITAGAVAASLDLGLYLCEKLVDRETRLAIQKRMNYRE